MLSQHDTLRPLVAEFADRQPGCARNRAFTPWGCSGCSGFRRGSKPTEGTFVNYPAQALLDIVALESHRAGAFLVAEDLGTVQEYMREAFMKHQMLSYRLLWLEDEPPSTYPERSMAAITTHDLFTIAGLWNGTDFRSQESIGLRPHRKAVEEVTERITKLTGLTPGTPLPEVAMTVHRLLAEANSMVIAATLDDALLVDERPNMPGTTDQWPNWKLALPATIEEIQQRDLPRQVAEVLNRRAPFRADDKSRRLGNRENHRRH